MRVGITCSIAMHAAILVAAMIGWPSQTRPLIQHSPDVPIEIVRFDELSNPPPGKKPEHTDETKPDDEETKAKNQANEGGRTDPRSNRDTKLPTKPETKPEPPKVAMKEAPKPALPEATPKTDQKDIAAPKRPETLPEPPKPEVREAPTTDAKPEAPVRPERETAMPKRPETMPEPPKPAVRDVPTPTARPDDVTKPERETAAPKRPTAPPKPEPEEAMLRTPPKPEPREAPKVEAVPRPAVKPTPRPEAPPKPGPSEAALRAPNKAEAAKEPERAPESASRPETDAKPDVRSKPTFRPDTGKPGETRESKATRPDKRPADFDSMMKSLDTRRKAPREGNTDTNAKPERAGAPEHNPARMLSIGEMDAIRRQIQPCWNMDAAARNARSLIVEVRLDLDRDGSVMESKVVDSGRMGRDAAYRAAGEAALRAVRNPRCTPLKLPAESYDRWRSIIVVFDPSRA